MIWCIPKKFLRRHILCVIATTLATGYSSSSLFSYFPTVHSLEAATTTAVAVVKTAADSLTTAVVAKTTAAITIAAATNTPHKKSRSLLRAGLFLSYIFKSVLFFAVNSYGF